VVLGNLEFQLLHGNTSRGVSQHVLALYFTGTVSHANLNTEEFTPHISNMIPFTA
ncbi:uncharacterized protein METZ01_LOCUS517816, partial [marine metagenome]